MGSRRAEQGSWQIPQEADEGSPQTDRNALARQFCDWLFPDDRADECGPDVRISDLDREGRAWGIGRAGAERRIADLPPRTLAAAVEFTGRAEHPEVQHAAASLLRFWCARGPSGRDDDDSITMKKARDLASLLVLSDLLSTAAESGKLQWVAILSFLLRAGDDYGESRDSPLGSKPIPWDGVLAVETAEIRTFRAWSFGRLLRFVATPNLPLTPEKADYLRQHIDQHERITRIAMDRGTLDPAVLSTVLASTAAAVAEGAL